MFGFARSGSVALDSGGVRHALLAIPRHECLRSLRSVETDIPGELSLRGLSDSNSPFVPPIVCRQNLWDQTGVFRREGLTTYNAPTRLRGVTEKPPIRTLPFDLRPWFSKAVSKISPRLGSTRGDWRGLQGTRSTVRSGSESRRCEKSRAPSASWLIAGNRVRFPPPPPKHQ
jgi:hypothetical protein